jgi:hypothetical protein
MTARGRPFKRGECANPAGRPLGSKNKKTLLRQQIERCGPELIALIRTAAFENQDMSAAGMLLARLEPPLRPSAQRVEFELDPDAPIADQAKQVVLAMSRCEIDPDTAKQIMDMLSAFVGLKDVETFLTELKRLRESKQQHIPGGVVER